MLLEGTGEPILRWRGSDRVGRLPALEGRRILVVSPHLDDAVFGCGDAITANPGATVVTVFAGGPVDWGRPTAWDAASGFGPGDDAVARRREEDREALRQLAALPVWLPFWDSQYQNPPAAAEEIEAELAEVIRQAVPHAVYIPLGLGHGDHRQAHEAAAALIPAFPKIEWWAYEEAIYRRFVDSGRGARQDWLRQRGLEPTWIAPGRPASEAKRRSIACYRSQLRALASPGRPGWGDVLEPELYWALRPTVAP
jgi:LmbE family N-acetylglucosaminyl deacetylase